MNWLRYPVFLLLSACALVLPLESRAGTTCTASMTHLDFGEIDPNGTTAVTATIDYECRTATTSLSSQADVSMCLAIGGGSAAGSSATQRRMRNTYGEPLTFSISQTPSSPSNNWGDTPATYRRLDFSYPLYQTGFLFAEGETQGQVTVHGRIPPQTGLAAGEYRNVFNDTRLIYRYRDRLFGSSPSNCESGGDGGVPGSFPFTAMAEVPGSCTIQGATDLNFGTLMNTSTGVLEETSTITMSCTRRTAWQVGLDDGLHANGNTRRLHNSGAYIAYELNRTAGWDRWGDTLNSDTVSGTGSGTVQQLTVHGRITNQPLTQAGRYSDTIKVVVTY